VTGYIMIHAYFGYDAFMFIC